MPVELTVKFNDKRYKRMLNRFQRAQPAQRKKGMFAAGTIFLKEMKSKTRGEGFTRNPSRSSSYPGVNTGEMRRTMNVNVENDGMEMRVGPHVNYAQYLEFHEHRNTKIKRPFVRDTLTEGFEKAVDAIARAVFSPLR